MNRTIAFLRSVPKKIHDILTAALGTLSWQRPAWLRPNGPSGMPDKWHFAPRWVHFILAMFVLGFLVSGLFLCLSPTPKNTVRVTINAPGLSEVADKKIIPRELVISFEKPVAPLDQANRKIVRGIQLSPSMPGTWAWEGEQQIRFTPSCDWPAATKYSVKLNSSLFPTRILLSDYQPTFVTAPFEASIPVIEFYIDPKNPDIKEITATLKFTHPVDAQKLVQHLEWFWQDKVNFFTPLENPSSSLFTVIMDDANRAAYIRSPRVRLPEKETYVKLILERGLPNLSGGTALADTLTESLRVPDKFTFLAISDTLTTTAKRDDGLVDQLLTFESGCGIRNETLQNAIHLYLLPLDRPLMTGEDEKEKQVWHGSSEVTDKILSQCQSLPVKLQEAVEEYPAFHSLKFSAPENRYLYLQIKGGISGLGGFVLKQDYQTVIKVSPYPKELCILQDGAILALSGERKLSIFTRSLKGIDYRIGRVAPGEINHLVSQSEGSFQSPVFKNYNFDENNICEILDKHTSISTPSGQPHYQALDFTQYLQDKRTGEHRGLFLLSVTESKESENPDAHESSPWSRYSYGSNRLNDHRLILVTDLGIITKQNADSSQDVFVQSIKTGRPVPDAKVEVLGKNGLSVASVQTDREGRATLPVLKNFKQEKTPVAIIVRKKDDLSFMPYGRQDRRLNFSRYDISGLELPRPDVLSAFIFSDRGLYRPGDTAHFGVILRQMDWEGNAEGLPLVFSIGSPDGHSWDAARIKTPAGGFIDWSYATTDASRTGEYTLNIFLDRDQRRELLGSTTFRVEEFLPDRLKIKTAFSGESSDGWVTPNDLKILVELNNLFGSPSIGHKVSGQLSFTPSGITFARYADMTFFDPLLKDTVRREAHEEDVPETVTDDFGKASLDLNLLRFNEATYRLTYLVRGFEKESGRSVSSGGSTLVSSRPWLVGFKADGDLHYIHRDAKRVITFLAVDPHLNAHAAGGLRLSLVEESYNSVLTKQPNGTYAYRSILRELPVKDESLHLKAKETLWPVPTQQPGNFVVRLFDTAGVCVSTVRFSIVGAANLTRQLDRNAELVARISKVEFNPGEEISIAITAPYTGSGLISIERDRVYAHSWFSTRTLSSTQKITIPQDFEGNGYLNVAFVRALDSREIYMSPLSYAVIPFRVNREKRTVKIELSAPTNMLPGDILRIGYRANRSSQIVVYAVDEGILQVARYTLPKPLDHFMPKHALQVTTDQIMDLILPEYSISREAAATGGDGREDLLAAHLNPFKRKNEAPVVFWSGILDCDTQTKEVTYRVPDYFNGTIRVMAVAVNSEGLGASEQKTIACSPLVIQPTVPTFVAPGDTFDVSVLVANNIPYSGPEAKIALSATHAEGLEIERRPTTPLVISEKHDGIAHFVFRAKDILGNADIVFTAKNQDTISHYTAHLSIRPPVPYHTDVASGTFSGGTKEITPLTQMYPHYFKGQVSASAIPLGLCRGLKAFLNEYPHGCSEQLASRGLSLIATAGDSELGLSKAEADKSFQNICSILRSRQSDQGAFRLWPTGTTTSFDFVTPHVMLLLVEAQERGFPVMPDRMQQGMEFLTQMARATPKNLYEARNQAMAIYLITRSGTVTSGYLDRLQTNLKSKILTGWENDATALFVASTYALLHQDKEATRILQLFSATKKQNIPHYDFYSPLSRNALYLYLLSRHFPDQARRLKSADLEPLVDPILRGEYSTYSSAYAIMGLRTYADTVSDGKLPAFLLQEKNLDGLFQPLPTKGMLAPAATLSSTATAVQIQCQENNSSTLPRVFYQVVRSGFDRAKTTVPINQGLEVYREFHNSKGEKVDHITLGEELEVQIQMRSTDLDFISNVVIEDLLPGGFEVVIDSIRGDSPEGIKTSSGKLIPSWNLIPMDNVDAREDRIVLYGNAYKSSRIFIYRIKAIAKGRYVVPPAQAESMYDHRLLSRGVASEIIVENNK